MGQWINFAEVRARISLEDVLYRYYQIDNLKRDGAKLVGPCPVHGGDSPRAFHADLEKNVWHCFSQCQGGGNQLDLVAKKESIGIRDAALRLQAFFLGAGGDPPAPVKTPPPSAPARPDARVNASTPPTKTKAGGDEDEGNRPLTIKLDLKPDHPHLLQDRALKLETVQHFGVGYCSRGILRGMIAIPIHDEDGDLVAYAGRRLKPSEIREFGKYKFPKGFKKERVLYNLNRAKAHASEHGLILVEGFFDVVKLHDAGIPNVVAAMGCELSDYQVKLLSAHTKEVIILFDGNEAGWSGAEAARQKLAVHVSVVRLACLPSDHEPETLPPRALRWLVNGLQALDLAEVSFDFAKPPSVAEGQKPPPPSP